MQQGQSGPYVFAVQPDGTVRIRPVTVGETLDGRALIDQGLHAGDTVVTAGQYRLDDGVKVASVAAGDPRVQDSQRNQRGDAVMSLSSPFIRRPVATALLMVAIVLLGASPIAAAGRRAAECSFPTISVTAQLPGADPQTMASSVATPLEKQFGQIPYLTQMTSTSSTGYTQITLQFALNDDINAAAQLVQTAINAAAGQIAEEHADAAHLSRDQSSGCADPGARADLGCAADHDGGRLCREHPGAEAVAGTGRRARRHRRRAASGNPHPVQSGAARGEWPDPWRTCGTR